MDNYSEKTIVLIFFGSDRRLRSISASLLSSSSVIDAAAAACSSSLPPPLISQDQLALKSLFLLWHFASRMSSDLLVTSTGDFSVGEFLWLWFLKDYRPNVHSPNSSIGQGRLSEPEREGGGSGSPWLSISLHKKLLLPLAL
ncbi:hypothetical protein K1719_000404 [Acacia pycnantha]|nr:hypothetical protein K1719_000404 [Acacia pycnantha]